MPLGSDDRAPLELNQHSLLWRWGGDNRRAFTGITAGLLQTLHPAIGTALIQHSDFFNDPWDRVLRSVPQIYSVIYAGPEELERGTSVRDKHRGIRGTDDKGRNYNALDPSTFWWAHATFQNAVFQIAEHFSHHQLTRAEEQQLYREGLEWYRRYGMPMTDVPKTLADYRDAWDHVCEHVLEMNPAAAQLLRDFESDTPQPIPGSPHVLQATHSYVGAPVLRLCAIGLLPPRVRERFDIAWTPLQNAKFRAFTYAVRRSWRFAPPGVRWSIEALRAWERVGLSR